MADMSSIISGVGSASTWFFGLFADMINMITSNNLLLFSVLFAIVAGTIGLVIKVIRRFGLKGRR